MQKQNNWGVSYAIISFFDEALKGHNRVASHKRENDIQFLIFKENGDFLNVLLVDEYSIGLAAVLRAKAEFPEVDYIVTGGAWNGYTPEAKEYGNQNNIGIFNTSEFFGALNWNNPKEYHQKDRDGAPRYAYKNP